MTPAVGLSKARMKLRAFEFVVDLKPAVAVAWEKSCRGIEAVYAGVVVFGGKLQMSLG
jgi:hypothetical protein